MLLKHKLRLTHRSSQRTVKMATTTHVYRPYCSYRLIGVLVVCGALSLFAAKSWYLQPGEKWREKVLFGAHLSAVFDKDAATIKTGRTNACSPSRRVCSTDAIRNCAVARNSFPNEKRWTNVNAMLPGSRFLPTFCRFKHNIIPPTRLQRCLQKYPIRRITLIGDSHGSLYYKELQQMLEPIAVCTELRKNTSEFYFSRHKRHSTKLPKQRRRVAYHTLSECVFVNSSARSDKKAVTSLPLSIIIENIAVISFTDRKLPNTPSNCSPGTVRCSKAEPRMLFPTVFGDYLVRESRYPDVIMLFSNSHDKGNGKTLNKTRADIASLRDVINRYVPRTTTFYWFSQLSENDSKKKWDWQDVLYEGKYSANEMLVRTNRAMNDVLRDDIRSGRIRTFFDLYAMTITLPDWSRDGIHLTRDWYVYLMSYWFQSVCSKFM